MLTEVARRIGWGQAFPYRKPAEIFREHAALSAFENNGRDRRLFDIGALAELSDDDYDWLPPVRWPLPRGAPMAGDGRLFAVGGFPTDDARARFIATIWRPPASQTSRRLPLLLNTGRVRDQWHTMTRTGRVPRLMMHVQEPLLDMHPHDAEQCGVTEDAGADREPPRRDGAARPPLHQPAARRGLRAHALDRPLRLDRSRRSAGRCGGGPGFRPAGA
jgi:assimilatory nitrate reductase catalytic subunit